MSEQIYASGKVQFRNKFDVQICFQLGASWGYSVEQFAEISENCKFSCGLCPEEAELPYLEFIMATTNKIKFALGNVNNLKSYLFLSKTF